MCHYKYWQHDFYLEHWKRDISWQGNMCYMCLITQSGASDWLRAAKIGYSVYCWCGWYSYPKMEGASIVIQIGFSKPWRIKTIDSMRAVAVIRATERYLIYRATGIANSLRLITDFSSIQSHVCLEHSIQDGRRTDWSRSDGVSPSVWRAEDERTIEGVRCQEMGVDPDGWNGRVRGSWGEVCQWRRCYTQDTERRCKLC